jgi:hypothetical protein
VHVLGRQFFGKLGIFNAYFLLNPLDDFFATQGCVIQLERFAEVFCG